MSGFSWPDICKKLKSRIGCWCQCVCCPGGDVVWGVDDEISTEDSTPNRENSPNLKIAPYSQTSPLGHVVQNQKEGTYDSTQERVPPLKQCSE